MILDQMLEHADRCDRLADKARDKSSVDNLRNTARQWRHMAIQMDLLHREPAYRIIRDRRERGNLLPLERDPWPIRDIETGFTAGANDQAMEIR